MYAPSKLTIEMAIMPCPFVFGSLAAFVNPFLIRGAFAKADPVTSTSAICIEKARSPQIPLPQ